MKKSLTAILSVLALVLVLGATPAFAQGRIATVDLKKLFDNYWKTKQADTALKARGADLEKEFKSMMDDYNKGKEEYKTLTASATDPAISDTERERKKKDAEEKLTSLKQQEDAITKFQNQARTTIDEQRRRMRDNILVEIRKVVDGKAKVAGYLMVVDIAAESINNTPVVLYNTGETDITDAVLSQLNAGAPAEAQDTATSSTNSNTSTNR
jgi:outer membrane protein